jgi:hypothetical protein
VKETDRDMQQFISQQKKELQSHLHAAHDAGDTFFNW